MGADFVTFNGSQLHAPQGTGALFMRKRLKANPLIYGGNEQAGLRAGVVNMALLAGLGEAARESQETIDYYCTEIARLRNRFEQLVCAGVPGATVLFSDQERLPHCTCIAFPRAVNEALLFALDGRGVYASMGGGSFQQIAMNLVSSGVDESVAQTALSFSLGRTTTEEQIEQAASIVVEEATKLANLSQKMFL
jgi:cysteine desulfurase